MSTPLSELRAQAAATAESLGERMRVFGSELRNQAYATTRSAEEFLAEDTRLSMMAGVALKDRVRAHPLPSFGVAAVLGFASTVWFRHTWAPALRQLAKEFQPELRDLRRLAFTVAAKATSNQLNGTLRVLSGELARHLAPQGGVESEAPPRSEPIGTSDPPPPSIRNAEAPESPSPLSTQEKTLSAVGAE